MGVKFKFEDDEYSIPSDAFNSDRLLVLPDGTVLVTNGWIETDPPQPQGLRRLTIVELANELDAVLVEKVE